MKSKLNLNISGYANYRSTTPVEINLLTWLKSDKYKDKVFVIRETEDKKKRDLIKATLPAITPSGIFSKRESAGLVKHSGLMQFDIDGITDIESTKAKIISLSNVAYCGLSVSGRGLWGLIPIAQPDHHKEYFYLIEKAFAGMGITIDGACKDVSRLRGYSYDPDAYFNHDATILNKWYENKTVRKKHLIPHSGNSDADRIAYCLNELSARKIDLTTNWNDWIALGFSFASLGEQGRSYFHSVSGNYPGYNPDEVDKTFDGLLKKPNNKDLSTFFGKCKAVDILYKEGVQNAENEPKMSQKQTLPDYPESWNDCTSYFSDKWQLINHLVNKGKSLEAATKFANNDPVRQLISAGFDQIEVCN